jgi:ACS family sodium-dependent inorganic phosphate cotransporter
MLVVIFFTFSIGLNAFMPSGLLTNPMDLSPNYAGTIMSIGNAIGALCGIIAPFTVGLLTPNVSRGENIG